MAVIEVVPEQRGDSLLSQLRRRRRGRPLGRMAIVLAAAAAALVALVAVRGGDGTSALADITRPNTIAVFDTRTGEYVKTLGRPPGRGITA